MRNSQDNLYLSKGVLNLTDFFALLPSHKLNYLYNSNILAAYCIAGTYKNKNNLCNHHLPMTVLMGSRGRGISRYGASYEMFSPSSISTPIFSGCRIRYVTNFSQVVPVTKYNTLFRIIFSQML